MEGEERDKGIERQRDKENERSSAWKKGQELGRCTMGRRKWPRPEHKSPHEQRLREVVSELVQEESQKAAYLAFAHELAAAERSSSFVHRSSSVIPRERRDSRNLAARQTGRDPSIGVGVTKGREPSQRTKRVVAKWFRRGLSGHLMWLIGKEVLGTPG